MTETRPIFKKPDTTGNNDYSFEGRIQYFLDVLKRGDEAKIREKAYVIKTEIPIKNGSLDAGGVMHLYEMVQKGLISADDYQRLLGFMQQAFANELTERNEGSIQIRRAITGIHASVRNIRIKPVSEQKSME